MERPVIVGVDDSDVSLRAVEWAAAEAARRGLRLSVVTAFPAPSPDAAFVWPEGEVERSARAVLDRAQERAAAVAPDLGIDGSVASEGPVAALLQHAEEASLLVVGLRGRGGLPGLGVGSVAYRVAAHSPVPVVVVGPEHAADDRTEVVVGEDGSAHAELAVGEAFEAAVAGSGEVRVVRAWSTPVLPLPARISPPRDRDAFTAAEERVLEGAVDPWQSRYPSVPVHIEVVEARPVAALAHAARNARLLVVGASGRHGFLRSALGSTAHGLLHRSPCPVMVVRAR